MITRDALNNFFKPFQVVSFLYPLKTSENQKFWEGFQGRWKWIIDLKWIKLISKAILRHPTMI